jgi:hypothetical protein
VQMVPNRLFHVRTALYVSDLLEESVSQQEKEAMRTGGGRRRFVALHVLTSHETVGSQAHSHW